MKLLKLKAQLERFKKDEDGAITAYIVATFLLMVLATGMAIDLMRHEVARADIQNALDRAVLAAAARSQSEEPELVFNSYMETRNYHELDTVNIDYFEADSSNFRSFVRASAHYDMPTWFMKLIGITELTAPAASSALEGIGEVEIVLVLDTSFSMSGTEDGVSRIQHLRTAARNFIDTVLDPSEDRHKYTTVSVVPFSQSGALQEVMARAYTPTDSTQMCFNFGFAQYGSIGVSRTTDYSTHGGNCPDYNAANVILPFSNDPEALKSFINNLSPDYSTSQHSGMKWGLAMIDPSFRDVMQDMVGTVQAGIGGDGNGISQAAYWGTGTNQIRGLPTNEDGYLDLARANSLPRDYGYNDVQKIVVLMTDGHNRTSDPNNQTPRINQALEYQCDLIHGRAFDTDVFEDSYDDTFNQLANITPLTGGGTAPLQGVTVYTVSMFPPVHELLAPNNDGMLPTAIHDKVRNPENGDPYVWSVGFNQPASNVHYDFTNWQDKPTGWATSLTADDNQEIHDRVWPLYAEMVELLSDDPYEGCASAGYDLVVTNASELDSAFSEIAAEITRLKLVN